MTVVGFAITKIEARREKTFPNSKINITSSPKILDVKETNLDGIDKKALEIEFDFVTTYSPDVGSIRLVGEVFYIPIDAQKSMDIWKRKKQLPDADSIDVLNFIFRKCVLKALGVSDELQLPPPLNLPFVSAPPQTAAEPSAMQEEKTAKPMQKIADEDAKEKELEEKIKKLTAK